MTWYCKEFTDSRTFSDSNGALTGSKSFHVWSDNETLNTALLVQDKFGATATNGETLPAYRSYFDGDGRLVAVSPSIRPVDSSVQLWLVTWQYAEFTFGQKQPNEVGFVEFTANGRAEFRDKWRINTVTPSLNGVYGALPVNNIADIGGEGIDLAGEPLSALHVVQEISISVTLAGPPNWDILRAARGRRNSAQFGGILPGYLLFADYAVSRAFGNKYKVSYRMVEDADAHLVQQAYRDATGKVTLAETSNIVSGALLTRASHVTWTQPFPGLIDFYSIDPWFAGQI